MARKEINVFGASFLDLLSGALGAVIILYILVPKINIPIEEFEEQKKLSEEVEKLGLQLDELAGLIPEGELKAIQDQMDAIIQAKKELEQKVAGLQKELADCLQSREDLISKIKELEAQVEEKEKQIADLQSTIDDLRPYKEWMVNCGFTPEDDCPETKTLAVDVGFKFKGKNLLFIIDASGSMLDDGRMGEVKAGIKMLITTMGPEFNCDIMWFADQQSRYYEPLFNGLRPMSDNNKSSCFSFLNGLTPDGGTPTGAALEYAFSNSGYDQMTDIILLSDGLPTVPEGITTQEILEMVRRSAGDVAISTIGVGKHMLNPDPGKRDEVEARRFLEQLARENNGFFYGF